MATPGFAIINMLVGFIIVAYVLLPIAYWNNLYNAKRFPILSAHVFDSNGAPYNISAILTEKTFEFNNQGYDSYSKVYLSIAFVFTYGLSFATLAATLSHVALFYGGYRIFLRIAIFNFFPQGCYVRLFSDAEKFGNKQRRRFKTNPEMCTLG